MSKLLLVLVGAIFLVGCAALELNIQDPTPVDIIHFDADRVEVALTGTTNPDQPHPWARLPIPLDEEVQKQLHEAVLRNAASPIVAARIETERTVIVQINKAVIMETINAAKTAPFLGALFIGMNEEFSVIIEGYVEIEDNQGRVIEKAPIRVHTKKMDTDFGKPDIYNKVIEDALFLLHDEIIRNSRRYLHAHLL